MQMRGRWWEVTQPRGAGWASLGGSPGERPGSERCSAAWGHVVAVWRL